MSPTAIDSLTASVQQSSVKQTNNYDIMVRALQNVVSRDIWAEQAVEILDLGHLVRQYRRWASLFPNVTPYYAVKCRDDPIVLASLAFLGCGFDCASRAEIEAVVSLGVHSSHVIYANPSKPVPSLQLARKVGVKAMTFDNASELYKIKEIFPDAELILRLRVNDSYALEPLGEKFGVEACDVLPLLQTAQELDLNVVGVSFHVGCGCQDPKAYRDAIMLCRNVFDVAKTVGYTFNLLDIGGGFPGKDEGDHISLEDIAKYFQEGMNEFFPSAVDNDMRIISEPGQYFVRESSMLASGIVSKRVLEKNGSTSKLFYYLNDGAYGSFVIPVLRRAAMVSIEPHVLFMRRDTNQNSSMGKPLSPNTQFSSTKQTDNLLYESVLYGPTCDSGDRLCDNILLPELELGDWIYFPNIGAYTRVASTLFNGMTRPNMHYVYTETKGFSGFSDLADKLDVELLWLPSGIHNWQIDEATQLVECDRSRNTIKGPIDQHLIDNPPFKRQPYVYVAQ